MSYEPTIEDIYQKLVLVDGQPCTLQILDTGGEYCKDLGNQWIEGGEGFILVYSITSRESFQLIRELHSQIREKEKSSSTGSPTEARKVPVVIVGNKSDERERAISLREGSALAKELGCKFSEVSAQRYQEVEDLFYDVARRLQWQRQQCDETPHDHGDPRLFMKSVGESKRNCGFCLTECSAIFTWLRSNVGPSKYMI
jgi:GTPase KRas